MNTPTTIHTPRNCNESELAKVGVTVMDDGGLRCQSCATPWWPLQPAYQGRMPNVYWKCPNGCNDPEVT